MLPSQPTPLNANSPYFRDLAACYVAPPALAPGPLGRNLVRGPAQAIRLSPAQPLFSRRLGQQVPSWGLGSFVFDGASSALDPGNTLQLTTSGFSILAAFRTTGFAAAQAFASKWQDSGNNRTWLFTISGPADGTNLRGDSSPTGSFVSGNTVHGATTLAANTWYVGGFVYETTDNRVYLNGSSDGVVTRASSGLFAGAAAEAIGRSQNGDFLAGNLYALLIYRRALSGAEMRDTTLEIQYGFPTLLRRVIPRRYGVVAGSGFFFAA